MGEWHQAIAVSNLASEPRTLNQIFATLHYILGHSNDEFAEWMTFILTSLDPTTWASFLVEGGS